MEKDKQQQPPPYPTQPGVAPYPSQPGAAPFAGGFQAPPGPPAYGAPPPQNTQYGGFAPQVKKNDILCLNSFYDWITIYL